MSNTESLVARAVSTTQSIVSPASSRPSSQVVQVFFKLELIEETIDLAQSTQDIAALSSEVPTIKLDKSYQLHLEISPYGIIGSSSYAIIQSEITIELVCNHDSIAIDDSSFPVSFEEASSYFERYISITTMKEGPTDDVTFGLLWYPTGNTRKKPGPTVKTRLEGTYTRATEEMASATKVQLTDLDIPPPEQTAIIHVASSGIDKITVKGWNYRCGKLQVEMMDWLPIRLEDFIEQHIKPEEARQRIRRLSRSKIDIGLIRWLKRLLNCYGKELCLIIVDHTDMETPWEMLELQDEMYLGAQAMVVRWTPVKLYDKWRILQMQDMRKVGSVIAYLDDVELGLTQTYHERKALSLLKKQDYKHLEELRLHLCHLEQVVDIGLIYISCHGHEGSSIGSLRDAAKRITALDLERPNICPDPRPIVFVNACESARLKRDGRDYFNGLLEVLLARFASGYIGTVGKVGSAYASMVAKRIMQEALTEACIPIAEVMRKLKEEAAEAVREDELAKLNEHERDLREAEFLFAFMYVYYGNGLARLRLMNVGETEPMHES